MDLGKAFDENHGIPIMKIAGDNTFQYESPYWENDELLNEQSVWEEANINAKYDTFLTVEFNTIKVCILNPFENCYSYTFKNKTFKSAKELFTSGFIRLNQSEEKEFVDDITSVYYGATVFSG